MALRRARFLQSLLMTVQGLSAVSVSKNIASLARVYSSHLSSDALSMGLSFHCLSGWAARSRKRRRCSFWLTLNQNFTRWMPLRTKWRSNSGACFMNSWYSSVVQKPITRSTPARLYQLRSKSTISPCVGRCSM